MASKAICNAADPYNILNYPTSIYGSSVINIIGLYHVIGYLTSIYKSSLIYVNHRIVPCYELSYKHVRKLWDTSGWFCVMKLVRFVIYVPLQSTMSWIILQLLASMGPTQAPPITYILLASMGPTQAPPIIYFLLVWGPLRLPQLASIRPNQAPPIILWLLRILYTIYVANMWYQLYCSQQTSGNNLVHI